MAARVEVVHFTNHAGRPQRLFEPLGPPRAYALFAHCFTCSKQSKAATEISRKLAQQGFAVLRFDFAGLGGSEGDFAATNFSSNVDDLVAAAAHLGKHFESPRLLVGHSLGGTAVLAAAQRIEGVEAVCTIGAPADPAHVKTVIHGSVNALEREGEAEVDIGGRTFTMRKQFLDDISNSKMDLEALRTPLLIMHSPVDRIVGIENAETIYKRAGGFRSFFSLDDADHLLTSKEDTAYVASILATWAARYVRMREHAAPDFREEGEVIVEEWERPYTNRVFARHHTLYADEPTKSGGLDAGLNPYEFLLAALGSCTSMTLRMYAARKEWPLEKVTVRLQHQKIHAEDCADCETKEGKVDEIRKTIEIEGDLSNDQRKRLREIAEKCPVNRTLLSEIHIVQEAP